MDISKELLTLSRSLGRVQADLEYLQNANSEPDLQTIDRCRELGKEERGLELRMEELQRQKEKKVGFRPPCKLHGTAWSLCLQQMPLCHLQRINVLLSRGAPTIIGIQGIQGIQGSPGIR
jgi:hypothetical protein